MTPPFKNPPDGPLNPETPADPRLGLKGQRGFTLLELMAVLGLMALIMALVLPGLRGSYVREQDRANLRKLVVAMRAARSEAATRRQRVRVFVDIKTGQFRLEGSAEGGQLTGMKLSDARLVWQDQVKQHGYVAFYGDGSSTGGRLRLVDHGGQPHVLEVGTVTGRVSLKKGET
jgi:prepilin-type N-terminal cleavage/methylation domain-containing protein